MKRIKNTISGKLYSIYRVLLLLLIILVVLIIGGGLIAILRPSGAEPILRIGGANSRSTGPGNNLMEANEAVSIFNGIGRLRIPVAGKNDNPATMILSVSFPYPPADQPFTEELAAKIVNFRSLTSGYFSSLPAADIIDFDESKAKAELLRLYNAILRLGKIEVLYFSDLLILEAETQ